jgi:hypothetical protein
MEYSGSDWLKRNLSYGANREMGQNEISQLGMDVADLLGELFYGIYHIESRQLNRVDWSDPRCISISIGWRSWSTIDDSTLTRLVFLAHHRAIRVNVDASTHRYIKLLFHQRKRGTDGMRCHPTLDEAVKRFMSTVSLPEYTETLKEGE